MASKNKHQETPETNSKKGLWDNSNNQMDKCTGKNIQNFFYGSHIANKKVANNSEMKNKQINKIRNS